MCKSFLAHKAQQKKTASGIGVGRCCVIAYKCSDVSHIRSSTGHVLISWTFNVNKEWLRTFADHFLCLLRTFCS